MWKIFAYFCVVDFVVGNHHLSHNDCFALAVLQTFNEIVGRVGTNIFESFANIFQAGNWLILQPNVSRNVETLN